jgi:hypothetical protein
MSHTFRDNSNREWTVSIDVAAVKRLKASSLEVDLMEAVGGDLLQRLTDDPILLVDVIYVLLKPQLDALNLSDEQFGQAMGGDSIDAATAAFLEGLCDFFPSGKRRILAKMLAKMNSLLDRRLAKANEILDSDQLDKLIEREIETADRELMKNLGQPTIVGEPSISSPASSA